MLFSFHKETTANKVAFGWKSAETKTLDLIQRAILKVSISGITWIDGHRKNSNFLFADFLFLDIDDGEPIGAAIRTLADTAHIIATTKSHRLPKSGKPACDRYRIVIPFEQRIENLEDYKYTSRKWADNFGADTSKADGSSMFFPCTQIMSFVEIDQDTYSAQTYTKPLHVAREKPILKPNQDILDFIRNTHKNVYLFLKEGKTFGQGRHQSVFVTYRLLTQLGENHERARKTIEESPFNRDGFTTEEFDHATRRG